MTVFYQIFWIDIFRASFFGKMELVLTNKKKGVKNECCNHRRA